MALPAAFLHGNGWQSDKRPVLYLKDNILKLYRFLSGPDDSSFCHKVTEALNRGWALHGSSTYACDAKTGEMRCGQAVVKEVEGRDYDPEMKLSEQ